MHSIQTRSSKICLCVLACFMGILPALAGAQHDADRAMIARARGGIMELGKSWSGDIAAQSVRAYAELYENIDNSGIKQVADISYGDHALQKIDLYVSEYGYREPVQVSVYFHGGGLTRGDKSTSGANIAQFMARSGGIGINANYRLAPDVSFPAGAEDIRKILDWIKANVGDYGGDPDNIFLLGNSAGSTLISTYLFQEKFHYKDGPGVRGAVLASGAFRADDDSTIHVDYYGASHKLRRQHEPLGLVDNYQGKPVPLFLFSAALDVSFIEVSVADMYAKLCSKYQDCPKFTQFARHNHLSHMHSVGTADTEVAYEILKFYHDVNG